MNHRYEYESSLASLDWQKLTSLYAGKCFTLQASEKAKNIRPNLSSDEIVESWKVLEPLSELVGSGYYPQIQEIDELSGTFKRLSLGSMLDGLELYSLLRLTLNTEHAARFCRDLAPKCAVLDSFSENLFELPAFVKLVEKSVDQEGEVKDTASKELESLRRDKRNLASRIQGKIKSLLHDHDIEAYLQDDFFTVRNDRYVIPMRLDGHGRIAGNVVDTSSSGQTLFLEPVQITELNQKLLDIESKEKIEVLKILHHLSSAAARELQSFMKNYETLVILDLTFAKARVSHELECAMPELSERKTIELKDCFHPLISHFEEAPVVKNDIELTTEQNCLVISGPNAGGKTVILKTLALCHLMAKSGLLVPCSKDSKIYLFEHLFVELGDGQNLSQSLSTFSSHLMGLKRIVSQATDNDLVLLDEIAVGTEPKIGASIAQATLEWLSRKKIYTFVTTHFEKLKILAIENASMRNASMEYDTERFTPSFKLILDVPGQSFGVELAKKMGLPSEIIERAKALSGQDHSKLDAAIDEVIKIKQIAMKEKEQLKVSLFEAEKEKNRWQHETELLAQTRKKAAEKIKIRFESQLREHHDEISALKKKLRELKNQDDRTMQSSKSAANEALHKMKKNMADIDEFIQKDVVTPGIPLTWEQATVGANVFVVPLGKKGSILKINKASNVVDVQVGLLNLKSNIEDLTLLKGGAASTQRPVKTTPQKEAPSTTKHIQTSVNTINLRGMDSDQAVSKTMDFLDTLLLRGEPVAYILHGIGTHRLKNAIRTALKENCPYHVSFRPGEIDEGGDGTTVVTFK